MIVHTKESLREYHLQEMALSDWTSGVNHAWREGFREGFQEGLRECRREGAQEALDLLSQGKTIEEARKILGLDDSTN
jgi:flagellar biosynthesis/type III secretory pathway protein FliH